MARVCTVAKVEKKPWEIMLGFLTLAAGGITLVSSYNKFQSTGAFFSVVSGEPVRTFFSLNTGVFIGGLMVLAGVLILKDSRFFRKIKRMF